MKKRRVLSAILVAVFAIVMMPLANLGMQAHAASNPYPWWNNTAQTERSCTSFAWQCVYDRQGIALPKWGNAVTWWQGAKNAGIGTGSTPKVGAVAVWDGGVVYNGEKAGHVAYVTAVTNNNTFTVDEGGRGDYRGSPNYGIKYGQSVTNTVGQIRPGFTPADQHLLGFIYPGGSDDILKPTMSKGYDRVIPDGDYIIANSRHTDSQNQRFYYLDVKGYDVPANNNTNIQLYDDKADSIPASDVWTVKYNDSDKFYTITQKGTNMSLNVYNSGNKKGTNVCLFQKSGTWGANNQKWAITWAGNYGFRIQAKVNSGYLDVYNNGKAKGTNVQLWTKNADTNTSQVWEFIPYKPTQSVADGRYKIMSGLSSNLTLDVEGAGSNVEDLTNVQVWNYGTDKDCDTFDIKKLSNGYYSITHAASGKSLDVRGGFSNAATYRYANISMYSKHGGLNQQFAITKCKDGYIIRPRCSGLVVDVDNSKTDNGTNVRQTQYWGGNAQVWKFVSPDVTPPTIKNAKVVKQNNETVVIEADITDNMGVHYVGNSVKNAYGQYANDGINLAFSSYFTQEWIAPNKMRFTLKRKPLTESNYLRIQATDAAGNNSYAMVRFTTTASKYLYLTVGQKVKVSDIWESPKSFKSGWKDYSFYNDVASYLDDTFTALKPGRATFAFLHDRDGCAVAEVVVRCSSHTWDAGKITKAATETSSGVKTFTCTACKSTKTETIPKLKQKTSTQKAALGKNTQKAASSRLKSLWASKHEVGKVTFKWTKQDKAKVSGWQIKYRTRKIGGNNKWSVWKNNSFGASTMQATIKVQPDYVIEIHAKAKEDKNWSQGVITTPAGGKYQAMKYSFVKNVSTNKRITAKTINLKKGSTIKLKPDHEYPVKDYKKRPRLYPTHMLYDIGDSSIISISKPNGEKYTGGIIDGIATVKALKKGTTTLICRAPNGRTYLLNVTVK